MNSPFAQSGVTLLELLVVMTIATILMAIGIPSYKYVTTANRVAGEINALLSDMQYARYEAVKEGLPVEICPANAATATTCDTVSTWQEGWIVLSNAAATGGTQVVLRRQTAFTADTLVPTPNTVQSMVFNREGFAQSVNSVIKFSLQDPTSNSAYTRCLMVGVTGLLMTARSGVTVLGKLC